MAIFERSHFFQTIILGIQPLVFGGVYGSCFQTIDLQTGRITSTKHNHIAKTRHPKLVPLPIEPAYHLIYN